MKRTLFYSVPQFSGAKVYRAEVEVGSEATAPAMLACLAADHFHDHVGGRLNTWPLVIVLHEGVDTLGASRYEITRHLSWSARPVSIAPDVELLP